MTEIRSLALVANEETKNSSSLRNLHQLESLYVGGRAPMKSLDVVVDMRQLGVLVVRDARELISIDSIAFNKNLEVLSLGGLSNLQNIDALAKIRNLRRLYLAGGDNLSDFSSLSAQERLLELWLVNISGLNDISFLENLKELQRLHIQVENVSSLDLKVLTKLPRLRLLTIPGEAIRRLRELGLRSDIRIKTRGVGFPPYFSFSFAHRFQPLSRTYHRRQASRKLARRI